MSAYYTKKSANGGQLPSILYFGRMSGLSTGYELPAYGNYAQSRMRPGARTFSAPFGTIER